MRAKSISAAAGDTDVKAKVITEMFILLGCFFLFSLT